MRPVFSSQILLTKMPLVMIKSRIKICRMVRDSYPQRHRRARMGASVANRALRDAHLFLSGIHNAHPPVCKRS